MIDDNIKIDKQKLPKLLQESIEKLEEYNKIMEYRYNNILFPTYKKLIDENK